MARQKSRVRVISVEPVNNNDSKNIMTYEESQSSKTVIDNGERKPNVDRDLLMNPDKEDNTDLPGGIIIVKPVNKGDTDEDSVKKTEDIDRHEPKQAVINDVIKENLEQDAVMTSGPQETPCDMIVNKKDRKKDEKKKKKKKEKKEKNIENDSSKDSPKGKGNGTKKTTGGAVSTLKADDTSTSGVNEQVDAAAIAAAAAAATDTDQEEKKKTRKLPCCFGFISTWIAKRKERRRAKKRIAIEARKSKEQAAPILVEYEHKRARGGVAFTVEVDSRPIRKPVLPPIPRRQGPIMLGTDDRIQNAEVKRAEELVKKKKSSQEHAKKRAECVGRKEESEFYFKQKAFLTIRYRQADAERNRKRYRDDQRSNSSMLLRAPSTLPPLERVYLKQSASANMDDTQAIVSDSEDEVDEVLKF